MQWPTASRVIRPAGKFVLIILSHPDCPCTQASLAELDGVMAAAQGKLSAFVLFSKPGAGAAEIQASGLWSTAARIPNVSPRYDAHGAEAKLFHGRVSGQSMLYDPDGRLIFSGGITSARGHQGDNDGAEAIVRSIRAEPRAPIFTPVFGCSLHDPDDQDAKEDPSWR
jgi:hypothetical protein